ncbi:MAG TPA: putative toxin-antitoxin system toxin component, PIN family [Terriglobales bacterium]|jgi:putative PIN family toxin of toxin-antitoxin system|nr:putative toxin-antitoxin system toxin component, PIN family [Terriglobales bacterium]
MRERERIVADTNCLVSRLLLPSSVPGDAVRTAADSGLLLVSEATMNELADVLARAKFDRYINLADRQQFLRLLGRVAEFVPVVYPVRECRDPKDDKFLEVALNGNADLILTGDTDLLALHPWRGIAILLPAKYLKR